MCNSLIVSFNGNFRLFECPVERSEIGPLAVLPTEITILPREKHIPEPKQGIPTPTDKIALVIVPLLAFDKSGARVGYGKGFYDKFLKGCRPDCKKIGLSFFEPIEQISDTNEFDINLTHCITPNKLYQF